MKRRIKNRAAKRRQQEVTKKVQSKTAYIDSLPQDLIIEIVVQLVQQASQTPLNDLCSLKRVCRRFHEASMAKKVGLCMAVDKEVNLRWWNKQQYFDFLKNCAVVGNLQACFILGLEYMYNLEELYSSLCYLETAMTGGHEAAAYVMGIFLFGNVKTRSRAVGMLNRIAAGRRFDDLEAPPESVDSGNIHVERCRKEAVSVVRNIVMKWWLMARGNPCPNMGCGRVTENWLERRFCSSFCRWEFEFYEFYRLL